MKLGLLDLSERCLIEVRGSDARSFLNGILTNDIKTVSAGGGCYAYLCTPKGKILADLFCYALEDHFKLECHQNLKDKILELLNRYILIQKVSLQVLDWGGVGVLGAESSSFIQKHFPQFSWTTPFSHKDISDLWMIYKLQWGYPCFEFWMKKKDISSFQEKLGLLLISKEDQEILRIESKIPLYGIDMDENTIPQEVNLFHALNFKKGCYIGQETIARLQNLGHVNKQLRLFQVSHSDILSKGTIIHSLAGEEAGEITSSCYSPKYHCIIALGYLRYRYFGEKEFRVGEKKAEILLNSE